MGTPNREPQEYSRNIIECKDPDRYIPIIFVNVGRGSLKTRAAEANAARLPGFSLLT